MNKHQTLNNLAKIKAFPNGKEYVGVCEVQLVN